MLNLTKVPDFLCESFQTGVQKRCICRCIDTQYGVDVETGWLSCSANIESVGDRNLILPVSKLNSLKLHYGFLANAWKSCVRFND
jgi:hypothetical protein